MRRYSQSFTRVLHLLLVVALLLTFAAPAFAEGPGVSPGGNNPNVINGNLLLGNNFVVDPQQVAKAEALQKHLFINASGQFELIGNASDLGITDEEYSVLLQFLDDFNSGASVIGYETEGREVIRVGMPEFVQIQRSQIDRRSGSSKQEGAEPEWRIRTRWSGVYVYLNSSETRWVVRGYVWILAGALAVVADIIGTPLAWGASASAAYAAGDIAGIYGPKRMDLRFPWWSFGRYFYVRFHGSKARWLNNRWIWMAW